jgi:hypothetical protein
MATVEVHSETTVEVVLHDAADAAALRAALRTSQVQEDIEVPAGAGSLILDTDNVENILALWACGFTWSPPALARAVQELAPYARQSSALHSSTSLKAHQRMIARMRPAPPTKLEGG